MLFQKYGSLWINFLQYSCFVIALFPSRIQPINSRLITKKAIFLSFPFDGLTQYKFVKNNRLNKFFRIFPKLYWFLHIIWMAHMLRYNRPYDVIHTKNCKIKDINDFHHSNESSYFFSEGPKNVSWPSPEKNTLPFSKKKRLLLYWRE